MLSASASEKDGKVTLTLVNLSCDEEAEINLSCAGGALPGKGTITVLHHQDLHAVNDFENPTRITPEDKEIDLACSKTISSLRSDLRAQPTFRGP